MSFSFGTTGAAGGGFGSGGAGAFGSTGGGFGAAPAAGGAAASPFGGGTATGGFGSTGTSAFGGGATGGFGSAIKPATTGFGAGGGFGTTATTGGGMFGAQPAATGGFGAAPAAGGGLFGAAAASPTGGFGAASPTGFGAATTTTGGFGSTGSAFGGGATTGFGAATGTSAFGNNAAASPFGAPKPAAASPFGQTSGFGATSAFGSGGATGFGTPAPAAGGNSMFGGGAGTSAFGAAKSPSPFGAAPTTSAFGAAPAATGGFGGFGAAAAAPAQPQVGTGTPSYELTREQDGTAGTVSYHAITRMQAYAHKSFEELRWEDYVKRTNPQQAQAIAALNQPQAAAATGGFGAGAQPAATGFGATGGFGSTTSAFGATPASGGFGSAFGTTAPATTSSGFGTFGSQPATSGGMFGSTTRSLGFGATTTTQPATSAFGASPSPGFGAPATGGFGSTGSAFGTSSFGAPAGGAAQPAAGGFGGFGSTTTGTTGAFGATTGGAFGKPAGTTGGFGFGATATQQPAPAAGGFFGQNAGATQQPAGGSLFGGTSTATTGSGFSFGGSTPKPTTSTGFGGFGTNTTTGTGGFGTGGGFGTTGGFGSGGTGGFGATAAPTQAAGGTSLFGSTATGTAGGFGFGTNNTGAAGGTSLFGSAPKTGTGMFGSMTATTGGGGLFGSTTTGGSSLFGGAATANKGASGFNFGGGGGLTATTGTSSFGSFGSFGSGGATAAPATGGFGGGSMFGSTQAAPAAAAAPQSQQPSTLTAVPDVNPYGTGAFGAGLVEQNVKAALDSQSLKSTSSAASRLSTFAQDVGLPRGPLENSVASKRNLLSSSRYSIPVSFIRESGFKGTKSRFATITSASAASASGNALRSNSSDAVTGNHDDDFKFSSSLFRNSVAKRLVINKTDLRHDSLSSRSGSSRASVIPLSEEEAASGSGPSSSRNKVPLKADDEGYYSVVFRTLTNKKSFTLRLKRSDTVKEARDDVKRLLRATMSNPVSDVQLLFSGRVVHDTISIEDLNLREGDIVDVAIVEDVTGGNAAEHDHIAVPKKAATSGSDSLVKPQPSRFMSYADFLNSAMREEQEQQVFESHKPVSTACPSLRNEDYFTVPSYDRLKRMTEEELSAVEGFTVGCKGLGSVEWIGKTDVRHLDLDELIHFEKKEVIVYKDDENKHELGTGLNRPAIVELLGIFPPRKVQDPEAYKEKVKLRTRDIGSTYIDYTPSTGVWRFRVEHFSRYGFDDDDDDEDMEPSADPKSAAGFGDDRKKMAVPTRLQPIAHGRGFVSSDRVSLVRNSAMYRNQSQFPSRTAAVSSFRDYTADETMNEASEPSTTFTPPELATETVRRDNEDDDAEAPRVIHDVPTSIVFPVGPELLNLQPLGIDAETSLLPISTKSTTYQLFLQVANQSVVAKNQADPGLFLARSFRCSWGPNGELVNIGRPRTVSNTTTVGRTVTVEFPLEQRGMTPVSLNKDALELHYECCQSNVDDREPDAPVSAFALPGDDGVVRCLRKYAEFAERTRKQYPASRFYQRTALLWKLVQALWGQEHDVSVLNSSQFCPLAARDDPREIESMETFQMVDLRREAISKWFEDALSVEVGKHRDEGVESASEEGVLKLLCQHRVVEAAEMAMECGDFRLSTLISQAASYEGSDFRTLLADQLSQWSENSTLEYVEEDLVMIYSLLAGSVEVLTSKKASDMSWLMCLALFFWYKRGPATSLKTALTLYREAVTKSRANGPASESAPDATKDDVIMEVMKLYVEEAVSLCSVLSPSGFPADSNDNKHLDYELSWHLHSVLRAIGFRIERKWESHIHHNYIRQLEGAGLWEEAIYVSLNISGATERVSTCRELLLRNADLLRSAPAAKRVELCDKYALPMEWIDEALAVVAVSKHQYYEVIAHWMAARQYDEAHACLVRHIAPTCLFSGEKDVLLQLLVDMEPHATEISQWTSCGAHYVVGGGLVLEYLRLEGQQGIDEGGEVDFLDRLMTLAEKLSLARGSLGEASPPSVGSDEAKAHHQRNASELVVARTALSSMLVALSTRAVQLRALLDTQEEDQEDDGEQSQGSSSMAPPLPYQLQPDFLSSLSGLARSRETKFVESYRASQLLRLCASFVDWRA